MPNPRIQKAECFLKDAELLLQNKRFDSCVSRCYYAVYHDLVALLETQGIRSKEWRHPFVLSEFGKIFIHRRKIFPKEFSAMLYTIQRERNEADYSILPVSHKRAKRVFDKTCDLWNNINKVVEYEERKTQKWQGT